MARIELAPEVFDDFDMAQFGVESAPARIGEITGLARLCRGVPLSGPRAHSQDRREAAPGVLHFQPSCYCQSYSIAQGISWNDQAAMLWAIRERLSAVPLATPVGPPWLVVNQYGRIW
jgi:hypothetical protein